MKKILALLLSLLAVFSPIIASADSSGQCPILRPPTTSVDRMEDWAISKGANSEFVKQAQTFYDVSIKYGVDPAVTYAQSAKETNFFKFTGVLTIDFKNPCGLKTTSGGGNYDPDAHQRFDSWEEGITAQVHHLALYAGHPDFPMAGSPDPRHFPFIGGTAPTVESLGGKWAPSKTYGEEIVRSMVQFADLNQTSKVSEREADLSPSLGELGQIEELDSFNTDLSTNNVSELSLGDLMPIQRIYGLDRAETSLEVSRHISSPGTARVILASGDSFANALLASSLTKTSNAYAPIILVGNDIDPNVLYEIDRIRPDDIYIIGSDAQITPRYDRILKSRSYNPKRINGSNRNDTANIIAQMLGSNDYILVNNGVFADALSISAYAAMEEMPIMFTDGNILDSATEDKLKNADSVLIVGGVNSVSQEIENMLGSYTNVERISGPNRYMTAIEVARKLYGGSEAFVVANGGDFPDSLSGSPLAASYGAPILLTDNKELSDEISNYLSGQEVTNIIVLGGNKSISPDVYRNLAILLD